MDRRRWLHSSAAILGGLAFSNAALRGQSSLTKPEGKFPGTTGHPLGIGSHGFINLSINENQWGPSPAAREAMGKALKFPHEYPIPAQTRLKSLIARHEGVEPEQVILGAGSSDILMAGSHVFGLRGGSILSSEPTFNPLMLWARKHGVELVTVPWKEDFHNDLPAIASAIRSDTSLIYICNPENPVGTVLEHAELRAFTEEACQAAPVLIDEAYIEFAGEADELTLMDAVRDGLPVIITRTFSKAYGLGGMRVGYAVTTPELAAELSEHYVTGIGCGCSHVSLEGAIAAYQDRAWLKRVRNETAEARRSLEAFYQSRKIPYIPSTTTFILAPVAADSNMIADAIYGATNVKISPRHYFGQNFLRVSMGTPAQMERLITGLRLALA